MSGLFPQCRNIEDVWRVLAEGRDVVEEIPSTRFDWRLHYGDPAKDDTKTNGKWCGTLPGVAEFDAFFFGISPREADEMDPRHRLLLQESWRALEDAMGRATSRSIGSGCSSAHRRVSTSGSVEPVRSLRATTPFWRLAWPIS
jgi:acyl transferase domain-containing protein